MIEAVMNYYSVSVQFIQDMFKSLEFHMGYRFITVALFIGMSVVISI